jgi:DNA modification methylase
MANSNQPHTQQTIFETDQPATGNSGPVSCLGLRFPNDEERCKHFLGILREKLKDPEFRKIEGFPIGSDEDILALSDPPYYTACPNPFLADFIKVYGKPFNAKENYHRVPFAADVTEGKYDPLYKLHPFPTKVPHKAIMRYLLQYTEPGDIVFDGFCGTGMTGVAAKLCGNSAVVQEIGYRVQKDGTILDEMGLPVSKIGERRALLNDLSTSAAFISYNQNLSLDQTALKKTAHSIFKELENECSWMFTTLKDASANELEQFVSALRKCYTPQECKSLLQDKDSIVATIGRSKTKLKLGQINYVVWSDVFICAECAGEIVFWKWGVDKDAGKVRDSFFCPHCNAQLNKRKMERSWITKYDTTTRHSIVQGKQVQVLINFRCDGGRYEKVPDLFDLALSEKIESFHIPYWFPPNTIPRGDKTGEPIRFGITQAHQFYSWRNLWSLASFRNKANSNLLLFLLTKVSFQITKMYRFTYQSGVWGAGGGPLSGTLYIPSLVKELNILKQLSNALRDRLKAILDSSRDHFLISNQSSCKLQSIPTQSIDYIFLDPPFGSNLMYSELNFLWEVWLRILTNTEQEAIENISQKKGLTEYRALMTLSFREAFRILKPGRWMTVEFSNTKASVWNTIQTALQEAGFVVANVSALDKKKGSFKAVTTPTAVKQDLIISAYKPNGGLEERFIKKAHSEEGIWDFVLTHLSNLPSIRLRAGQIEFIAERDPRILYDRTVAYYVRHGFPVPLSSPQFQAGLADKFHERDGMYFLSEQAFEYDKKRVQTQGLGQMTIWVEDERSAVDWLRNFLKEKPSKYNDVQPEFFEQLNQSWKKWEIKPELRLLLDQNFLCYDGKGDVPPQIHAYLSTNFKDLRKLPADDPALRVKAKDRWYVPDPRKNVDVEMMRDKRLLDEFWTYLPPGYQATAARKGDSGRQHPLPGFEQPQPKLPKGKKLKLVRTEAVRVGFKHCYQNRDYATIIAVAHHIPDDVVNGDDQLQMIYDTAVTRSGGEP